MTHPESTPEREIPHRCAMRALRFLSQAFVRLLRIRTTDGPGKGFDGIKLASLIPFRAEMRGTGKIPGTVENPFLGRSCHAIVAGTGCLRVG